MILCISFVILIGIVVPLLYKGLGNKTAYVLALIPASVFTWFLYKYISFSKAFPLQESIAWNPYFNLDFSFYLDGLSFLFVLLISGIGTLIYIYAGYYMKDKPYFGRFFMILTLFMGAMLGLVLANNWLTILVFWEMTSVTSFLLIGYEHEKEKARYAAWQGLLVTAFGGLALLAGLVLIAVVTGEYTVSELQNYRGAITSSNLYLPILLCVSLGAFTKSAQVPFHFWLPNAMAAPTPVSAYLHSATMVKAGIYFFARFSPVLGNTTEWKVLLCTVGGLTMLTGAIMAFRSDNLKKLLAYSTISALGIIVLAFGIGTEAAIYAGLAYIIAHALYKSTLFMLAGIIDKQAGTKKISELPAMLYKKLPAAFVLVTLAALSFGGIAPFFGFVAKELLMEMVLHSPFFSTILVIVMFVTATFFIALLLILTHNTFFKRRSEASEKISTGHWSLYLAPIITAMLGLYFGIFPDQLSKILSTAAATFGDNISAKHLALWHGWNTALFLSIASIIAGIVIYLAKLAIHWKPGAGLLSKISPSAIYDYLFNGVIKVGEWQTRKIQTGYLRYYAMFTLLIILVLAGFTFFYKAGIRINTSTIDVYLIDLILGIIALLALGYTLFSPSKIDSLLSLSIVGIAISIIFFTSGAPDLAITFFLIDTLTVTIFVLILHKLPKKIIRKSQIARYRDAFIALGMGVLVTLILFSITYDPLSSQLKQFYAENSYSVAKGKNMVNVILVDFRAMDTFGEITVLAIGALGVFALVNYSKKNTIL